MSRQADRRGEDLGVRVSWLESDLDRVDEKFVEAAGNVVHAKTNLNTALQGLEHRLETYTDKLESKVERIEADHVIEIGPEASPLGKTSSVVTEAVMLVTLRSFPSPRRRSRITTPARVAMV